MTENEMLSRPDFVKFLLEGPAAIRSAEPENTPAALPGSFADFGFTSASSADTTSASFALRLLEASGLGDAQHIERAEVILGDNPAARSLPDRVFYWPKAPDRPHQTLLFEIEPVGSELLKDNLFKSLGRQQRLEDAAHRLIQHAQEGFSKGGEKRTAAVKQGSPQETLIVVSIRDDRDSREDPVNLIFFGTVSAEHGSFETFLISDEARRWAGENRPLADDHLSRLYYRHFSKLATAQWQDAFLTGEERKLARKLLDICTKESTDAKAIQRGAVKLVQEIAKSFGRGYQSAKLVFDELPSDHFIGADPKAVEKPGFKNAFEGMTIRDDRERLLGYIIYCLDEKKQADKLRALLAEHNSFHNVMVIYPDGDHATLELWQGTRPLQGKLTKAGARFFGEGEVVNLLSRFFVVSKSEIQSPKDLARELAHRAKYLRLIARGEIEREKALSKNAKRPVLDLYEIFDKALARQTEKDFADAYAQTLTYGLLAARWMSRSADKPFTAANVGDLLPSTSPFLVDLFQQLIALRIAPRLRWLIEDLINLLHRTSVNEVFADADRDPVIHFYEDFLDEYDPSIRAERGVYYTPDEVVQYIVNTAHNELIDKFGLPLGLADTSPWSTVAKKLGIKVPNGIEPAEAFVQLLDPATGTGTFLKYAIEIIHDTMMRHWAGADWAQARVENCAKFGKQWTAYVREHLLPRVNGLELMMAPYIVCHLRIGLLLQDTGFIFSEADRLRVFLTNTLEQNAPALLQKMGEHVAEESAQAERVKNTSPISIIVGNPPYERESNDGTAGHKGGWVRAGWTGWKGGRPLLSDYTEPASAAGAGGHLKNIYNLYVYFWRWATWRVFDRFGGPGIVSFITASSYLRGPGFVGMREEMRRAADSIHVLDLEGDQRGTRITENVFCITIPVCVASHVSTTSGGRDEPADGNYTRVTGVRSEKLNVCRTSLRIGDLSWVKVPSDWQAPLMAAEATDYSAWPLMTSLFPWQQSGCKAGRTWVLGESRDVLEARWAALSSATRDQRLVLFKNSPTGQKADHAPVRLPPLDGKDVSIATMKRGASAPPIERIGFRSFDRQWIFADSRLLDRAGPPNWYVRGKHQTYFTSLLSGVIGRGPGAVVSAFVPDLHHFRGSYGGKDAIPIWRDPEGVQPNISAGFLKVMESALRRRPHPCEVFAYAYAVMANPGYVARFEEDLQVPGPRLPVTKNGPTFERGVDLGRELIRWHTFGERFREKKDGFKLTGTAKVVKPIPSATADYPERNRYDEDTETLYVGEGRVAPVAKEVWEFSVSGFPVVKSWLDYRMKSGAGKKSSPLDDIRPESWTQEMTKELLELLWVLEWTLAKYPELDAWLEEVLASDLLTAAEVGEPTDAERKEPKVQRGRQASLLG